MTIVHYANYLGRRVGEAARGAVLVWLGRACRSEARKAACMEGKKSSLEMLALRSVEERREIMAGLRGMWED